MNNQDIVLICHIEDVHKAVEMIKTVSKDAAHSYLGKEGFAVWTWSITPPKKGERKESAAILCFTEKHAIKKLKN